MRPSLAALEAGSFDVLVIGGGITGAGIARDAAMRGLRVAIVEKGDFASGTSSRSSRLVHGGIRYLEHGQLRLVLESVRERERLMRIAPHLVTPLQFTWPVYRGARIQSWKLRAGLTLYDLLAGARRLHRHRGLGVDDVLSSEPALRRQALRGGASYHDAATDDARLTLANVLGAVEHGAIAANYARAVTTTFTAGRIDGVIVRDELGDSEIHVGARAIVSATGPWQAKGTKGAHIAVSRDRIGNRGALTVMSPDDGRVTFVLPAGDQAIIGTTDTFTDQLPDDVRATVADVDYLLRVTNDYFPDADLTGDDVISAWAGIRPLAAAAGRRPSSISREHRIGRDSSGVITVTGGKLTTYRSMAAEAVDLVAKGLDGATRPCSTADAELPGRNRSTELAAISAANPALGVPVLDGLPYTRADVVFAVEREAALTIADVLLRRTHLAFETRDHGSGVCADVAALMAVPLGWDAAEQRRQIERFSHDSARVFRITSRELSSAAGSSAGAPTPAA